MNIKHVIIIISILSLFVDYSVQLRLRMPGFKIPVLGKTVDFIKKTIADPVVGTAAAGAAASTANNNKKKKKEDKPLVKDTNEL